MALNSAISLPSTPYLRAAERYVNEALCVCFAFMVTNYGPKQLI